MLQMQLREQEGTIIEKQKLETLVNSIDGIVWEADARTFRFTFVSQQCERLLGYTPEQWMAGHDFWQAKASSRRPWASEHRARMVAGKDPVLLRIPDDRRRRAHRLDPRERGGDARRRRDSRCSSAASSTTSRRRSAPRRSSSRRMRALVDSSRYAGMAEVATGVLHNVGNVLNSVNVSGNVISDRLRKLEGHRARQSRGPAHAPGGGLRRLRHRAIRAGRTSRS